MERVKGIEPSYEAWEADPGFEDLQGLQPDFRSAKLYIPSVPEAACFRATDFKCGADFEVFFTWSAVRFCRAGCNAFWSH